MKHRFFSLALLFVSLFAFGDEKENIPVFEIDMDKIEVLEELKNGTPRNPKAFDTFCSEVELRHKASTGFYKIEDAKIIIPNKKGGEPRFEDIVTFRKYTVKSKETDLFWLSARCNIRYDTIATLNKIAIVREDLVGKTIILPSADGLFIPEKAESSVEQLLQQEFQKELEKGGTVCYILNKEKFYFIQNAKFSQTDRAFFIAPDDSLVMPLEKSRLTSPFGNRVSPITGQWKMHTGIDLASPVGSPVFACKAGFVEYCVRGNPVYGNYIVLKHDGKMSSVYAHLDNFATRIEKGIKVAKGETIGFVGLSGQTTGPHLHFEIRMDGRAEDPASLLPKR
jgi:murein DD-endopeptidase MepM/ murein hydrolase activator NlpD